MVKWRIGTQGQKMNRRWLTTLVALLPWIALLAVIPAAALARAGGGQNYGGGGGGFGGGDDFGGGFYSLWPLLFIGHGSGIGTLIVIFILLSIFRRYMRGSGQIDAMREAWSPPVQGPISDDDGRGPVALVPHEAVADPQAIAAGIAAIKAHDPNFDETAFLGRAQTVFFRVQQAWQARNQDIARDCMSDALYERHKVQTDQLIANHQINVLDNIVIGHAKIVGVNAGHPYDSIVVAISASMTDYTIDENTKQTVSGSQFPKTFTEYWTFIRRSDATSTITPTQLDSTCPSCGAPLTLENGKCSYCGAYVKTSSSDWVVDSIEQST
jgi:predicted lipid-binding transport protein (Tim44 family)